MSIMICDCCGAARDTDFDIECGTCEADELNPVKAEARRLVQRDWERTMLEHERLVQAKHFNSLSDDFAYTNGSDNAYREAIAANDKRRKALFQAMLYLT